jgi:N-acetylglutamate synthase-like GNAT family acetyltransferase
VPADGGPRIRRPAEADHPTIVRLVEGWDGGRTLRRLAARAWLRHFAGTSWLLEDEAGRLMGFLLGYRSPDQPETAVVQLIGVDQNRRRRGLGRELVERFASDVRRQGVSRLEAIAWPGDRTAVGFFLGVGFEADDGPGTMRLFGVAAHPDHDGEGEDRVLLRRDL